MIVIADTSGLLAAVDRRHFRTVRPAVGAYTAFRVLPDDLGAE